jgi:sugar transferase (PEP-CTERM/EpsH1 system associated)
MNSDKRPIIMHVIHHLVVGGMENGLVNLLNNLPETNFRHVVVCIEDYSDFRQRIVRKDIEVIAMHRSHIGLWKLRVKLFNLCRTMRPTIMHSRNLSGLDALLPARLAGVRQCIHGEHGRDVNDLCGDNKKLALLRRLHSHLVSHYITVSKDLQQYIINRVGVTPARITQIYNGVDTARFSPAVINPVQLLPDAFIGEGKIIIGTVGRLQPIKNQAMLLQAFAEFSHKFPELAAKANLAIVGNGPLFAQLRELAESLGIAEKLWLPGSLENIPDVLKSFDLFVLPSLSEGISNTILEAMATGLPVLATAVGGNLELVTDGYNGRFFQPKGVNALADLFANYAANKDLLKKHGAAARQTAVERFSLHYMVSEYQKIYTSCL